MGYPPGYDGGCLKQLILRNIFQAGQVSPARLIIKSFHFQVSHTGRLNVLRGPCVYAALDNVCGNNNHPSGRVLDCTSTHMW